MRYKGNLKISLLVIFILRQKLLRLPGSSLTFMDWDKKKSCQAIRQEHFLLLSLLILHVTFIALFYYSVALFSLTHRF